MAKKGLDPLREKEQRLVQVFSLKGDGSVQGHGASHVRAHCHNCRAALPDA